MENNACFKKAVFLAQSDTTIGFLCADFKRLNKIKGRNAGQNVLLTLDTFEKLKRLVRVPNLYKNRVRRSVKSTFIYLGKTTNSELMRDSDSLAVRVVQSDGYKRELHADFLNFFSYLYSSSANAHKEQFNESFALENASVVVLDKRLFSLQPPSKIYKFSNSKIKRIR